MTDGPLFNFRAYARDCRVPAAAAILCTACVFVMAKVLGVVGPGAIALALVPLLFFSAIAIFGYLRRRRFYRDLQSCIENADAAYYVPSLVERPDFLDGQVAYDACGAIAAADAERLTREKEAAQANREFAEAWAHEVKTPIAASKLIVRRMHGPDALLLRSEVERMEEACERILFNSRVNSLSSDYRIQETVLAQVCRNACKDLSALLIEKGATPDIKISEEVVVLADVHWLGFVIKQALSNSAKYGSSRIVFECVDSGIKPGSQTILAISDDGVGIPAEDVPRVFEHGWSGRNGRHSNNSTGMGLYLAAKACEAMGLGLAIESEQGSGTSLMIVFPHDRSRANLTES